MLPGQTLLPGHSYQTVIINDFSQKHKTKKESGMNMGKAARFSGKTVRHWQLFQSIAVVQNRRAVEEQHVLIGEGQIFAHLAGR